MLVARVVTFKMLESPKFLVTVGKIDEAKKVIGKLARVNGISEEQALAVEIGFLGDLEDGRRVGGRCSSSVVDSGRNQSAVVVVGRADVVTLRGRVNKVVQDGMEGLRDFRKRMKELLGRDMIRTSVLIWTIWSLISVGYTMFNGFLPKFLSEQPDRNQAPPTVDETYRNFFIVSLMGIPGSVIGMYLIDTRLGRRGTMSLSAFGTAAALYLFTLSSTSRGQLIASCVAAVLQNSMYGVLYTYTPEVFESQVRGTAGGVASALSRVFGCMAPILTGTLLSVSLHLPLIISSLLIALSAVCMILLPVETRGKAAM
ncbi:hypothetical protein HDU76_006395 [Blyttiomyces sp. JEL0837]|nr:hypothetical protein HDU76_006395 [Blyttiomyces sp. JEL0837]